MPIQIKDKTAVIIMSDTATTPSVSIRFTLVLPNGQTVPYTVGEADLIMTDAQRNVFIAFVQGAFTQVIGKITGDMALKVS